MKILVTGSKGFLGRNLCSQLRNIRDKKARNYDIEISEIFEYDIDTPIEELDRYTKEADFVFNLAGVNRPKTQQEFMQGNFGFVSTLLDLLQKHSNTCPVMISSSIQAELDNPYGVSKREGEKLLFDYGKQTGAKVLVYRFVNLFGKWSRPNYNSVVATFCNNIANDLPIQINDENHMLTLAYVDDVVEELIAALQGRESRNGDFCYVRTTHQVTLGQIAEYLYEFSSQPQTLLMPEIEENSFKKKLYSTYLSYLPKQKVKFELKTNEDDRGSFTELLKTEKCGQFSVNISKPSITKGEHWHNTKWEFFIVVSGHGLIQQRNVYSDEVIEFEVSGKKIEVVHMLPGYTHNIINLSKDEDLVTLMWANERFDAQRPDTYYEKVCKE